MGTFIDIEIVLLPIFTEMPRQPQLHRTEPVALFLWMDGDKMARVTRHGRQTVNYTSANYITHVTPL